MGTTCKNWQASPSLSLCSLQISSFETRLPNLQYTGAANAEFLRASDKHFVMKRLVLCPAQPPARRMLATFLPGSRTLVTKFSNFLAIGFFPSYSQNDRMCRLLSKAFSWRSFMCGSYVLGISFLACSTTLFADTPALLRTVPAGGCYCHCAESRGRGGCVKMCDSKHHASRWRGTECAKPHMQSPTHNSHAGPRFPHPGRAEHAKL
jgi:hypothetical protein